MIWSTLPFVKAHEALLCRAAELDVPQIEEILEPIKADLLELLNTPTKSEASRSTLAKKVVNIDDEEIEFNDAFLNDAAHVADELGLDELVAAKLAYCSIEDSKRLGIGIVESAILLFFVRRQLIIDIVRFCLEVLPESELNLVLKPTQRVDNLFYALKSVEERMSALNDKLKTGEFMGMTDNQQFRQLLKLQRSFYVKEHEALGNCLQAYLSSVGSQETSGASIKLVLDHVALFEVFDSRFLAYAPGLVTWLINCTNNQFRETVWNYFNKQKQSNMWKLPFWCAAISLVFFVSLVNEDTALPESIHFESVLDNTRHAIDEGGFEFWMSLAQDFYTQQGETRLDIYRPLVRSRVPNLLSWQPLPSPLTQDNIQRCLESVASSVIVNMADILKEMRLSEEDMYLAMSELDESAQTVSPGMDLERFFLLVAMVYNNQPESSRAFFEDEGDAFYGFLLWGTDCRVTLMAATFAELVAALANDPENCESTHRFLLSSQSYGLASGSTGGFLLSWSSILSVIDYYIISTLPSSTLSSSKAIAKTHGIEARPKLPVPSVSFSAPHYGAEISSSSSSAAPSSYLLPTQRPNEQNSVRHDLIATKSAFRGEPQSSANSPLVAQLESFVPQGSAHLSDDTLLVLSAYLHLLSRVPASCEPARLYLRGKTQSNKESSVSDSKSQKDSEQKDVVNILLKLLKMNLPIAASVFSALCPFSTSEMWSMLDTVILNRFDEVLSSIPDALSFVQLVVRLSNCENITSRINEYTHFILKTILPWATIKSTAGSSDASTVNLRIKIQYACLEYLKTLLNKSPTNNESFALCFESSVYESLFDILCVGVDKINALEPSHPLVGSITAAVEVVMILVELSKAPAWSFDKPILYHIEVIPHVALYAGSSHRTLSLLSINLLSLLNQCPEFMPVIGRQSRILSILSSTSEATRIRVGFMTKFDGLADDPSIKIAILEMLTNELTRSSQTTTSHMSVAHYLLGFRQSELGLELEFELDTGVGGIQSGNSLLTSICDTLLKMLISSERNDRLLRLCSDVVGILCQDPLTSEKVLDFLRSYDLWIKTIKYEPLDVQLTNDLFGHRATMLEIWISEIILCQKKMLLTSEGHYLKALVPIVFSLVDLKKMEGSDVALRCLSAWCKLVSTLTASKDNITGPTFVFGVLQKLIGYLPEFVRQSAEFAVPVAQLLVTLFNDIQRRGIDDVVARHSQQLLKSSLASIQPAQMNSELRSYLYRLSRQCLKVTLQTGPEHIERLSLEYLTSCGPRVYQIACDDVLGFSSNSLKFDALLFLQMSATLAHRLDSPFIANSLLKYNFVSVFIGQVLAPLLNTCNSHQELSIKQQNEYTQIEKNEPSTVSILKACLTLLIPISQTREGAEDVFGSSLILTLKSSIPNTGDDLFSLALQVLISISLSMGPDNHIVNESIKTVIELHQTTFRDVLQRDANLDRALQDQASESELSRLARNVAILISLTGASI